MDPEKINDKFDDILLRLLDGKMSAWLGLIFRGLVVLLAVWLIIVIPQAIYLIAEYGMSSHPTIEHVFILGVTESG
jgi:uncharacterized membrane protein YesL